MNESSLMPLPNIMEYKYRNALIACHILSESAQNDIGNRIHSPKPYLKIILKALALLSERSYRTIPGEIDSLRYVRWNDEDLARRDHNNLCDIRDFFNQTIQQYPDVCAELFEEEKCLFQTREGHDEKMLES